ncbi:MAG: ABC transporter permease [Clostridia bacterium]|nr:ABC transporter permease [Clostridia bacterium]
MKQRNTGSLNESLKRREAAARTAEHGEQTMTLDDTQRVKVLSPGRLVTKRFLRNKLAITGLCILIFMFLFAFIGPLFYPYSQTEIFYTFAPLNVNYASATERTEAVAYAVEGEAQPPASVRNRLNSYILDMEAAGETERIVSGEGGRYLVEKLGEHIYTLSSYESTPVAAYSARAEVAGYNSLAGSFDWRGEPLGAAFEAAVKANVSGREGSFSVGGVPYSYSSAVKNQYSIVCEQPMLRYEGREPGAGFRAALEAALGEDGFEYEGLYYSIAGDGAGGYNVSLLGDSRVAIVASSYVFDAYEVGRSFSDEFRTSALRAVYGEGRFEADGQSYTITHADDEIIVSAADGEPLAALSTFVVRRYSGQDTLSIDFKETAQDLIETMQAEKRQQAAFVYSLPEMDEQANYIVDENGDYSYVDTELTVTRQGSGEYVISCEQVTFLIDIYGTPSREHIFGTDGDGMDILARMMYGGRISLMVGFVVVIMETILGVIMGGIAGYFGRWVDTLIMRLVDIFYCIPTYPILIIMGAFFDAIKMDPYERLMWLMVILGILGWAGIARLVRGQILSLREQEFMVAQEATGMKARRRIARHLVPNVMPQLIVNATMGLGSVIITESTLSFLGLGVKHPLATWGTMINSVTSSSESMIKYTYIWVPVGLLICLTVIAFNFVGDGLRDAFDPKMKQ